MSEREQQESEQRNSGELTPAERRERITHIVATGALTMAVIGFMSGTSQERVPPEPTPEPAPTAVAATPSYQDLRNGGHGPNASLGHDAFAALAAAVPSTAPTENMSPEERERAIAAREVRRAFDGAPPTIPHAIDEIDLPSCVACHQEGAKVGELIAPKMSHPAYASCTQCHAPTVDRLAVGKLMTPAENDFVGLRRAGDGERAFKGAPPTIPHPTRMREQCDSCHGPTGQHGLKTPHPYQVSCTQCHAPSADRDQRAMRTMPGKGSL